MWGTITVVVYQQHLFKPPKLYIGFPENPPCGDWNAWPIGWAGFSSTCSDSFQRFRCFSNLGTSFSDIFFRTTRKNVPRTRHDHNQNRLLPGRPHHSCKAQDFPNKHSRQTEGSPSKRGDSVVGWGILPTHTMHYYQKNPVNCRYICVVSSSQGV